MVKSFAAQDVDMSIMPGRRDSNFDIGQKMLLSLAMSIQKYRNVAASARTRPIQAVEDLMKAAKNRSKVTGQSVKHVLEEHINALDAMDGTDRTRNSRGWSHGQRFLLQAGDVKASSSKSQEQRSAVKDEMDYQDASRANRRLPGGSASVLDVMGRHVDQKSASTAIVPHEWHTDTFFDPVRSTMVFDPVRVRRGACCPGL